MNEADVNIDTNIEANKDNFEGNKDEFTKYVQDVFSDKANENALVKSVKVQYNDTGASLTIEFDPNETSKLQNPSWSEGASNNYIQYYVNRFNQAGSIQNKIWTAQLASANDSSLVIDIKWLNSIGESVNMKNIYVVDKNFDFKSFPEDVKVLESALNDKNCIVSVSRSLSEDEIKSLNCSLLENVYTNTTQTLVEADEASLVGKKFRCTKGINHPNMGRMFKKGQTYKVTEDKGDEITLGGWNIYKKYLDTNFEEVEDLKEEDILAKHGLDKGDDKFRYSMLSRLQSDCKYYLGNGDRNEKDLWAKDPKEHIAIMKALYNSLPESPDWITMDEIEGYEKEMCGGLNEAEVPASQLDFKHQQLSKVQADIESIAELKAEDTSNDLYTNLLDAYDKIVEILTDAIAEDPVGTVVDNDEVGLEISDEPTDEMAPESEIPAEDEIEISDEEEIEEV